MFRGQKKRRWAGWISEKSGTAEVNNSGYRWTQEGRGQKKHREIHEAKMKGWTLLRHGFGKCR